MAIFNKTAKFTREQLLDHYLNRNSITDILYAVVRVLSIIVQNLYCISSYLVLSWLVLIPVNWLKSDLYSKLENYLYNSLLFIVSSWSLAAGVIVVESGDEYKHLIEEPEKHYPEVKNKSVDAADACVYRSKRFDDVCSKVSNNQESQKNNLPNGNSQNGCTAKSNLLDSHNGVYSISKNKLKTHFTNGSLEPKTDRVDGVTNGLSNGLVNGTSKAIKANKLTRNNLSSVDCNGIDGELTENHSDQPQDRDLMITAETNGDGLVNHNNNIISEHNLVTARKNSHQCNGIKRSAKDLTVSPRDSKPSSIEIRQNALKNVQDKPRILFLCNHISTADVPLIMQSFATLTNQSLLWVLDAQFKMTNFGVVCGSHGDFFVDKNSFADGSLREHVLNYADRNLLILFPEGGFLRKRIAGSNRYAIRNNLPLTKYVTHPRFGAFKDLIDPSVGVTHIVDATLMYDDIKNPLSILDILFGNKKEPAILHYKVYERSKINPTEEWLRNIWLEKDKLLTKYYEDRASVLKTIEDTLRVAVLDWFKILSIHLFFLLVCYLTIFRLFNATSVTMLKARELYYSNI